MAKKKEDMGLLEETGRIIADGLPGVRGRADRGKFLMSRENARRRLYGMPRLKFANPAERQAYIQRLLDQEG